MRINKHDTNGTKPLLGKGELGYDDYVAGGDVGRVYVGTGSENIALAEKSEVDSHINRVDNPHSVTKAQVGLGNVDNIADANKNVLSATKWATARTITLSGDVAGSASVDGSANVTITTTVQPDSVALGTDTTGNYVAGATAGTGISISGTAGEGWSPTITNTAPNVTTDISISTSTTSVTVNSSDGADGTIPSATTIAAGVMSAADKIKLDGIATGANNYVLPNASSIGIGGVKVSATSQTVAANAVTATASRTYAVQLDASGNALVNVPWVDTNTVYTHPTSGVTAGTYKSVTVDANGHVTGGTNPTTLAGYGITDAAALTHTHSIASTSSNGLMSAEDKIKLDGIATGATTNTGTVTSVATSGAITGGTITTSGTISHSTADGYLHVPATGTTNNGKVLTAGATAGSLSWATIPAGVTDHTLLSNIGTNTHAQIDTALTRLANTSGTNTGDNAVNSNYANDYRASNFIAGTNYLAPNGSAAALTNFPTLNQNTTGTASNVTGVVAVANGGTGSSTALVQGGVKYGVSTTAEGTTAAGAAGQLLVSGGTGAPTWVNNDLMAFPGSTFKKSVRVATTAALTLNAATATIDGVTLTASDRVLVKNQATASQNGIYTGLTTTAWVRAVDSDASSEIASAVVAVNEGTTNGGRVFTNTFKVTDTLGTTAMNWYELVYNTGTWGISTTGSAATLTTGRTIGMTGDVTWTSASFNGSANVTGIATLATITDTGTGTFKKITTNAKGLVTGTQAVTQADITGLLGTGSITNTMLANTAVANLSGTNTGDQTITLTGDVTGSGTGSFATTLANSGVTAGSYAKVTVDAKGRVTAGATQTMEDIPDATFKRSVRCATTANITLSGTQTIDGIAVIAGDRVLVKEQTTSSQNGIYVVAAGAWTRSLDADSSSKIASAIVAVDSGTLLGGKLFDNDFKTTDTLGTTAMTWNTNLDDGSLLTAGSTAIGMIKYNGTTAVAGQFDGGTTTPTGTTRLNFGGYFYPTYINLIGSADTTTASSHVFVETDSDGFVRPKPLADFKSELFASPTFTGTPTVPTPTIGTQAANKDYVDTKVAKVTSTDNAVVRFDGTTGDVQNSGVIIDDSGNIGIGSAPSNWQSIFQGCDLGDSGSIYGYKGSGTDGVELVGNGYRGTDSIYVYKKLNRATRYSVTNGIHRWYNAPSGAAGTPITWNQLMMLDEASLTIGSPSTKGSSIAALQSGTLINDEQVLLRAQGGTNGTLNRSAQLGVYKHSGITNATAYSFLHTQSGVGYYFWVDDSSQYRISSSTSHVGTTNGTVVGTQTSDERVKNIVGTCPYGLQEILELETYKYSMKYDVEGSYKLGFVAQQAMGVIPESVYDTNERLTEPVTVIKQKVAKEAVKDEEGNILEPEVLEDYEDIEYQETEDTVTKLAMDYQMMIPVLVNAIKEQQAIIESLQVRLDILEGAI